MAFDYTRTSISWCLKSGLNPVAPAEPSQIGRFGAMTIANRPLRGHDDLRRSLDPGVCKPRGRFAAGFVVAWPRRDGHMRHVCGRAKPLFPTQREWVSGSAAMLPAQTPAGIWISVPVLVRRS